MPPASKSLPWRYTGSWLEVCVSTVCGLAVADVLNPHPPSGPLVVCQHGSACGSAVKALSALSRHFLRFRVKFPQQKAECPRKLTWRHPSEIPGITRVFSCISHSTLSRRKSIRHKQSLSSPPGRRGATILAEPQIQTETQNMTEKVWCDRVFAPDH